MAGSGNTVTLTFAGDDRNLSRVLAGLRGKTKTAEDSVRSFGTRAALLTPALGYAAGAVGALSGVVGLLPSMAFAGGLALGALAIGTQGFGDALSNMDDPAKFAEALKKLSPTARETALAIQSLKPQFDALRASVQNQLFMGIANELKLMSGALLPTLNTQLGLAAGSFNRTALSFMGWLRMPSTVTDINTALGGSQAFLDGLLRALLPVSKAFLDMGVVAAPYMRELGDAIAGGALKFGEFIGKARETGQLAQWIETGKQAFMSLWETVKNLVGGAVDLAIAFGPTLLGALQVVSGIFAGLAGFIRENQVVMVPLISAVGLLVLAFKGAMAIVGVINAVRNATILWTAAQWLFNAAMWANPVTWIIIGIIALIAVIILCIVYWDEIKAAIVSVVAWGIAKWAEFVAWLTGIWNTIKAVALAVWSAITLWIAMKIAEALAFIEWLGQIPGKIGAWFGQAKDWAVQKLSEMAAWVASLPGRIFSALGALAGLAGRALAWFGGMVSAAVSKAGEVVRWMGGVPGRILAALGRLGSLLLGVGHDLVMGLWNGIKTGWNWLTGAVADLASSLLSAAKGALGIASPSKLFRDEVGKWIPEGMAAGILNNQGVAIAAAAQVGAAAAAAAQKAAQSGPTTGLGQAASAVLGRMKSGGQMFEDLSWRGMPRIVGDFNDQLLDMARAQGVRGDNAAAMQAFLERVVRDATPRPPAISAAGSSSAALSGIRSSSSSAAAPVVVNLNVAGSIRSDRELVSLIRDEMDRGGFRGVR